jgi:DNA primase small subunit
VEFLKASWEERKQYYTEEWDMTNVPNFILTTLKDREFGFDHNGNGPRDRYNEFNSPQDLKNFLQKR